ncbi:transporter substrate-binding domain-containing protein [Inquilinus sp. YAF38]|uniref:transporter substrate-binding domain-containing protein n=1 Tax=Inquilinus sp. YAF38 TaxID=3233084 RepID=UPI003F9081F2
MRLLAAAALLLVLPAAAAAADRVDTLDAVAKAGVLKVCTTGDYKPFTYLDPAKGEYEGIDIDMAKDLAAALGVKVEFVKTSWKTLMADFTGGACDMAMGGISVSLPRQKQAFFSIPIDVDGKTPITRCETIDKFQTVEQIDQPGVRVIEPPGGTNEAFVRERIKSAEITIFPDNTKIFDEILAGRADVMITDASETRLQQKLRPGLCAVHPDQPFTFAEKAYLLPRGDVVFKAFVDQWLNLRLNDGSHAKFSATWMG